MSLKSTSSFHVNVPTSVLFSEKLQSLSSQMSRIEEIEMVIEDIFAVEKHLSPADIMHISNMQLQMEKILSKYPDDIEEMIPLDEMRLLHFQERIDAIYADNEPASRDFIYAEKLLEEREEILSSII